MKKNKYNFSSDVFNSFDLESLPIIPILYQAGYLTITDYNSSRRNYKLGYPNFEVDESFNKIILEALDQIKIGVNFNTVNNLSIDFIDQKMI